MSGRTMKIAFIGPGILPIPPNGWGAVELLVWEYAKELGLSSIHLITIRSLRN